MIYFGEALTGLKEPERAKTAKGQTTDSKNRGDNPSLQISGF
jgi:hypothetical protein